MNRILIFEDDPMHVFLLRKSLAAPDTEILYAEDLEAAVRCLAKDHIDLVVADIRWEHGDQIDKEAGLRLLDIVKARDRTIQVILVTQYASPEIGKRAMGNGAFDVLDRNPGDLDFWEMLPAKVKLALHYRSLLLREHQLVEQ